MTLELLAAGKAASEADSGLLLALYESVLIIGQFSS